MRKELKVTDFEILPSADLELEKNIEEIEYLTEEELIVKENEEEAEKALASTSEKSSDPKKHKPIITYAPLKNEKGIRIKYKDGKFHSYEVTVTFKRQEVYDEKQKKYVKKQVQQRKTFTNKADAILWRNKHQSEKIDAKQRQREYNKYGATVSEAADAYYKSVEDLVRQGKKTESYLNQLRIQTNHFKRYFTGDRTKHVKAIDVQQIEDYFKFEEDHGACRQSIVKYKSHLKAIWTFMMKDKATYGVFENVVIPAVVTAPKTEFKAVALNYKEINELLVEACKFDDPSFLYLVVFSMTQGLRRGELCGLKWKDINFTTREVIIRHNRVQLVTKDTTKLPKRDKIRTIELHKAGYDTLVLYKNWQENILGHPVDPDDFVLQWEINLVQNYVCHTGKVSRKWKEIFASINKYRVKAKKEPIPYGRLHDGRHTYITLALQGVKKDDGTIIPPASYFQVFQSAGHSLPSNMSNTSTTVYNEDVGARWDITRFWNDVIFTDVAHTWDTMEQLRKLEMESLTQYQRDKKKAQKEARMEKARKERLASNPPEDILQEYE